MKMNTAHKDHPDHVFLEETPWCDFGHQHIREQAGKLRKPHDTRKDTAVRMFHWVRDRIRYRVGLWNMKASETLQSGEGSCTNKANLLVALLRAAGIPAGYCVMTVKGQDYMGPIVLPIFRGMISKKSSHIYCCVRTDGRWVRCDPSDDIELVEKTGYFNPMTTLINWDGISDGLLYLNTDHILKDEWPHPNIDHIFAKTPRPLTKIPVRVGNRYIAFLRENVERVTDMERLQRRFMHWLRANDPPLFVAFSLVLFWQKLTDGDRWRRNALVRRTGASFAETKPAKTTIVHASPALGAKTERESHGRGNRS